MKYMILAYGSQQDYDAMAGKDVGGPAWTAEERAAVGEFTAAFDQELSESGELVETRGLDAPVHAGRISNGADRGPVVTDGPYAETQEVMAGYWIVECESFDRATEIAARLSHTSGPAHVDARAYADVRSLAESRADLEL